jgi:lipoprotein-anchoring transpeptidase ErfK/SrfK
MKRILPVLTILVILSSYLTPLQIAAASAPAQAAKQTFDGDVVCLPNAYLQQPADCTPVGPSVTLTGLAKIGITVPPQPLPIKTTPFQLASIPYRYALAVTGAIPTYSSVADAIDKNVNRMMPAGKTKYLSYSQRIENENGVFYQVETGEWVSGDDIQTRVTPSTVFQGVTVSRTPRTGFGWILDVTASVTAPGFNSPKTGKKYSRFKMVTAYSIQSADGVDWVQIGPSEWIEDRLVGRVTPMKSPPEGVTNGRWIEVNLGEQTLSVYDNSQLVFATLMSSGMKPFYTRPGLFQIYKKLDAEQMSGTFEADHSDYYYLENVPWTMYFDGARAIHGAYWHTLFGYVFSHGCVNLSIADARWVFDWAKNGDYVYVWDPTGKTPKDVTAVGGP